VDSADGDADCDQYGKCGDQYDPGILLDEGIHALYSTKSGASKLFNPPLFDKRNYSVLYIDNSDI
jgi:hypothetical protein